MLKFYRKILFFFILIFFFHSYALSENKVVFLDIDFVLSESNPGKLLLKN